MNKSNKKTKKVSKKAKNGSEKKGKNESKMMLASLGGLIGDS